MLFDYCKPLYEQIKTLLLVGGEPLVGEDSMEFCQFISENYPHITIILDTNGIAFTKEWQQLAASNLMKVSISVNGSNEAVYRRGCQHGEIGAAAYRNITQNIKNYMALLTEKGLEAFAPNVSMVVNRDTTDIVADVLVAVG